MTSELLSENTFLWTCLWQSTVCLAVGLIASFIWRRRPCRAHRVLLLTLIAAVLVPAIGAMVKHYELGLFVTEPLITQTQVDGWAPANGNKASEIVAIEAAEHNLSATEHYQALTSAVQSQGVSVPWTKAILLVWIAVSVTLTLRLVLTFVLSHRLLSRAVHLNYEKIQDAARVVRAKLGLDRNMEVYGSDGISSPVVWCWGRSPVLLVPSDTKHSDGSIDWVSVLCHELAHWKRRDHISGLLAEAVVCVFPWNPLAWWVKRRLLRLSEQACDDWVVASGQPATDYAELLLDLAPQTQMPFAPAVVSNEKGLARRVRRILQDECGNPRTGVGWGLAVAMFTVVVVTAIAFGQTRPGKTETGSLGRFIERKEEVPNYVYVTGAVKRPGTYTFNSKIKLTISRQVAGAGGYSGNKQDQIQVQLLRLHDNRWQSTLLNLQAIRDGKQDDIELQPGDILLVGPVDVSGKPLPRDTVIRPNSSSPAGSKGNQFVYVTGAGARAGAYQWVAESHQTALHLLAACGFDMSKQAQYKVRLTRRSQGWEKTKVLNIQAILAGKELDVEIQPGDVLAVTDLTAQPATPPNARDRDTTWDPNWEAISRRRLGAIKIKNIEADAEARRRLAIKHPRFDYQEVPLSEVFDDLRKKSGLNIVPNWMFLTSIGFEKDRPISLQLRNVTFERALKAIVDIILSHTDTDHSGIAISYAIMNGAVVIPMSEELVMVVYGISDLLGEVADETGISRVGSLGLPRQRRTYRGGGEAQGEAERTELRDRILASILLVEPDSWQEKGGQGTATIWGTKLLIYQTAEIQAKIRDKLKQIRQTRPTKISKDYPKR